MNKISRAFTLHPATAAWFDRAFSKATDAQAEAWPAIQSGAHTLIAAPTGSGKTLAAFLMAIDQLVRRGVAGDLTDQTYVLYVSPLKALSNDIEKNLRQPLNGIRAALKELDLPDVEIRAWVRTGDTPAVERQKMGRKPPHIVVTTPESLYILLGSDSGRAMLSTVRSVIVDEIHALAPNKRGAHLALSLERLSALTGAPVQRIGLGATQKPIDEMARFLVGCSAIKRGHANCKIVDTGHTRARDLKIEVPPSPLEAVMSNEVWQQVYDQLAKLIQQHRTTLIFANTRRMVERISRALSERIGETNIAAHHGSLSREQRLSAEQRLKGGQLKALVATASLELGIDIGEVDLVCQLGSPRSISSFLQRVGRSGHAVHGTPKGRLFPLTRDELVETTALLASVARGELDHISVPHQPLDVLAQQIVAEVAAQDWAVDDLYTLLQKAWPYRALTRHDFNSVLTMLAEGYSTRRGRRGALIHYDTINGMLRARRGARLTAITSGGAIPDNADYRVQLEPENTFIGTVHEDFAVESLAGDIFQLGNQSYRILRVERGTVRVEDAHGQPPTIPFWLGEAPGRSDELSAAVSRLRAEAAQYLKTQGTIDLGPWLDACPGLDDAAATDLGQYLTASYRALGDLPNQETIVFERFFDESGGMQFVIHSPYGSRINRAWGLALRKRFCRTFNFELQAAATEDNIVISLSASHSFELEDVKRYLKSTNAREILTAALLDAPMFTTRWRWVASTALALPRFMGGKKRPPQLTRMDSEDLIAAIFPDQLACAENLAGEREIPDHPLVRQTIDDCLTDAMDIAGLERLLKRMESGEITVLARDLNEPSPLAQEVLTARPYAYLDDAPLEERRTQAVQARRWLPPEAADELGRLDPEAIARVKDEVWPSPRNAEELHDALVWFGFLTDAEVDVMPEANAWLQHLAGDKRVVHMPAPAVWIAAERADQFAALLPSVNSTPDKVWDAEAALVEIVRGRLEGEGPLTADGLTAKLGLPRTQIMTALLTLQTEGFVLHGHFSSANADEWCERRLLARIHRYTVKRLRAEIEPVSAQDFINFLFRWQRVDPDSQMQGADALAPVLDQLEGFEAPAAAWETEILPARVKGYKPQYLDQHSLSGRWVWTSLRRRAEALQSGPIRTSPITFVIRRQLPIWLGLVPAIDVTAFSDKTNAVLDLLSAQGASFFTDMFEKAHLMRSQAEDALAELVAAGVVTSDSFSGLRALLTPADKKRGPGHLSALEQAGRWSIVQQQSSTQARGVSVEHAARTLLRRYGVVFQRLLENEASWLPPWRELLGVYRRLEDRGEIRGGRFVAGFAGEQFALPEAIGALRQTRRDEKSGALISLSGADPLNVVGLLTPGPKIPRLTGNRVLYRDGLPVAVLAGQVKFLQDFDEPTQWDFQKALLRGPVGTGRTTFRFQRGKPASSRPTPVP